MAVLEHAFLKRGTPAPPEWVEYIMCHSVMPGITLEQVRRMDYEDVKKMLICYSEDNKMASARG